MLLPELGDNETGCRVGRLVWELGGKIPLNLGSSKHKMLGYLR